MCGIAGCVGFGPDTRRLLEIMNNAQEHRGPDGEGVYAQDDVGLAHRSLAIIDRDHGAQPMSNAERTHVIAYNGEAYNYRELREELRALGYGFTNDTDTEVVLQTFRAWGAHGLDRINGMFGLAVYEEGSAELTLARDHFGIKPLYYINLGTPDRPKLLFASEIKALLATGAFTPEPNDRQIYRYLRFRAHEDSPETFFKDVFKLMPGELMTVGPAGMRVERFSNLPDDLLQRAREHRAYSDSTTRTYAEMLTQSIRARLVSEVPVGSCVSGGMDSSTIALTINNLINAEDSEASSVGTLQNTFSAVFPGSINDEEKYVDEVLATCAGHVDVHKIHPTPASFLDDLTDFVRTQEEPTISTGPYAQYKVMEEAAKHVTVVLDGQGADEMLAGYPPYYLVYWRQLRREGRWLRLAVEALRSSDVIFRLLRFRIVDKLKFRREIPAADLLRADFKQAYADERFPVVQDDLKKRFVEDIFHNSLPALLRYEDKNSMRFSIEGRVPFLDKDVVNYVFGLDDTAIIHGSWNKRILREATAGLVPDDVRKRRNKIGFTTPETEWFNQTKDSFYEVFTSPSFAGRPYFNAGAVVGAFQDFMHGRSATGTMTFWRLLNVELWLREFIDQPVGAHAEADEERPPKPDTEPNPGKQIAIETEGRTYLRYPLQTDAVRDDVDLTRFVTDRTSRFVAAAPPGTLDSPWYVFISEKIVAITQGRAYFVWDIKPSTWAKLLSRFVVRTPHGIGLGSPWTMELAIRHVGLPRVLFASAGSVVGKLVGKRGLFYRLVGSDVNAIDGPTEYSVYPSNVSAKLPPAEPDKVAEELTARIRQTLPAGTATNFQGVVVIDANDLGQTVLGVSPGLDGSALVGAFKDNPLGQGSERTPLCVVVDQGTAPG